MFLRTTSSQVLSSSKDANSTTCLENFVLCFTMKKIFLMFKQNFFVFQSLSVSVCLLSYYWTLLRRDWHHVLNFLTSDIFPYFQDLLLSFISSSSLSLSSYEKCSSPFIIFVAFCYTQSSMSVFFSY